MSQRGFTLVEMLVALVLFSFVMLAAVGSLVAIIEANRKARNQKVVMNNLNAAVENMSRTIRLGSEYTVTDPQTVSFTSKNGLQTIYTLDAGRIWRSEDGGTTYLPLTSTNVDIQNLTFEITSQGLADTQPKVLITVYGEAGARERVRSPFTIQTTISQRLTPTYSVPQGECEYDVGLTIDTSGSVCDTPGQDDWMQSGRRPCPNPSELGLLKEAVTTFVSSFAGSETQIALTKFDTDAQLLVPLTRDLTAITSALAPLDTYVHDRTNMAGGILLSHRELAENGRDEVPQFLILLTDGYASVPSNDQGKTYPPYGTGAQYANTLRERTEVGEQVVEFADAARADGINVVVVAVGVESLDLGDPDTGQSISIEQFLERHVADYPTEAAVQKFVAVDEFSQLERVFQALGCGFFRDSYEIFEF